jgi:hypothetical protein
MVTFNLESFGTKLTVDGDTSGTDVLIPHHIFSIVLEKSLGRIDGIVFEDAYQYPGDLDTSYLTDLDEVYFKIVDPGGIDEDNIRVYIDGELVSVGLKPRQFSRCTLERVDEDGDRSYCFDPDRDFDGLLTEGFHTLKIEAWDKSDAVNEADWQMLERTVSFCIDVTPPLVVTHTAQRDGIRYFRSTEGATAAITIYDEGVGLSGKQLQQSIMVDVFQHLTEEDTPMRTLDQGNIINFQRKVLRATSRPILEYCDDYTPDGTDNETWIGVNDRSSDVRHEAWRASYTIQMGQIKDGDTYEVVFYAEKPRPTVFDNHNENAVYL